jgi:methionyl-tRNA formyltransferase
MLILANDSHFACRILKPVIQGHSTRIKAVVISNKIRGRVAPSLGSMRKCSRRYTAYRVIVDMVTRLNALRGRGSVSSLAKHAGIPVLHVPNVNRDDRLEQLLPADLGLAINFDQILNKRLLGAAFQNGVFNLHASRLPHDKGISPALWAFARGDEEIWATIYKLDEGLDTGPVIEQFALAVRADDTAFSMYERICCEGGERLCRVIGAHYSGELAHATPQHAAEAQAPFSWPDLRFDAMLQASKRRLFGLHDVVRALSSQR